MNRTCGGMDDRQDREDEFLHLFLRFRMRIFGFIAMLVPSAADAEDLFQDTAVLMWRKFDEFEPGTDFAAWGIQIARYKVLQYREKQRRGLRCFSDEAFEAILHRCGSTVDRVDDRSLALQGCLRKLGASARHLIRLRYEEHRKVREIAEVVGRSTDMVYKTLAKVHRELEACVRRTLTAWEGV